MRGAVAKGGVEHREFVSIREKRGRSRHERNSNGDAVLAVFPGARV
jgi:hypothetical protein